MHFSHLGSDASKHPYVTISQNINKICKNILLILLNIQNSPKNRKNEKCSKIKLKNKMGGAKIDLSI